LLGWWGNREDSRFRMTPVFEPVETAELWQLSNPPILSLAPVVASLELFRQTGMDALRTKSERLTGFLDFLLERKLGAHIVNLTPAARGCQLSLAVRERSPRDVFERLTAQHVIADFREPDAIRVAPVPFYNRYADVYEFVVRLERALSA